MTKVGATAGRSVPNEDEAGRLSLRSLEKEDQTMPKVTRNLPHIRQPEDRHRDDHGAFAAFVSRQYLPQFFRYI